jgi:hypothetical protein
VQHVTTVSVETATDRFLYQLHFASRQYNYPYFSGNETIKPDKNVPGGEGEKAATAQITVLERTGFLIEKV